MKNAEDASHAYYDKACEAIDRADFKAAIRICIDAAGQFERAGAFCDASVAYHLLGGAAYKAGDLKDARAWYLKSLSLIEPPDEKSQLDYASTCNNLAAVVNALGEHSSAEEWLRKSLRIKESLGDKLGMATTYNQLGVVADTQSNFKEAQQWYLQSLSIHEEIGNIDGVVGTLINLANVAEKRFGVEAVEEWYRKALHALDQDGKPSTAERLGGEAERVGHFQAAAILYKKAYEMSKQQREIDQMGQRRSWWRSWCSKNN